MNTLQVFCLYIDVITDIIHCSLQSSNLSYLLPHCFANRKWKLIRRMTVTVTLSQWLMRQDPCKKKYSNSHVAFSEYHEHGRKTLNLPHYHVPLVQTRSEVRVDKHGMLPSSIGSTVRCLKDIGKKVPSTFCRHCFAATLPSCQVKWQTYDLNASIIVLCENFEAYMVAGVYKNQSAFLIRHWTQGSACFQNH